MIPYSSIRAKAKRHKNIEIPEILDGDCQNTHTFLRSQPYSRPSAEAGRQAHLHLCQPRQLLTRERAGQAQIPHLGNRQYHSVHNDRLASRKPSCAICERIYNNMRETLAITPYTAAGAALPDGRHARNCGPSQPDQHIQEPRLCRTSQADILISVLNANNRPVQTVVQRDTQPHSILC